MNMTRKLWIEACLCAAIYSGCTRDVEVGRQTTETNLMTGLDANGTMKDPFGGFDGGAAGNGGSGGSRDAGTVIDPIPDARAPMGGVGGGNVGGAAGAGVITTVDAALPPVTSLVACAPDVALKSQIAAYSFDQKAGLKVIDKFGNAGVAEKGFTWDSNGIAGGAGVLARSPITVPSNPLINKTGVSGSFTIAAWIKLDALASGLQFVVRRGESGTDFVQFALLLSDGVPQLTVHFFTAAATEPLPLKRWVHVAATYNGVTELIYVDGKQEASLDIGWPITAETTPLVIGGKPTVQGTFESELSATIDDVMLFDQELTLNQVQELATCSGKVPKI